VVGGVVAQARAPRGTTSKGAMAAEAVAAAAIGFVHLSGEEVVPVEKAREHLERGSGYEFRELGWAAWVREALDEGLHPLVAAFLESSAVGGAPGAGVAPRRIIRIPVMQSDLVPVPHQQAPLARDPARARTKGRQPVMLARPGLAAKRGMSARLLSVLLVLILLVCLV
jgi:hypothetical protein